MIRKYGVRRQRIMGHEVPEVVRRIGEQIMGKYKGAISARCLHCDCKFIWHMEEKPFLCCEIVGTCDHCLNRRNHNCYDEFQGRKI